MKLIIVMMVLCSVSASAQELHYEKWLGFGIDSVLADNDSLIKSMGVDLKFLPIDQIKKGYGWWTCKEPITINGMTASDLDIETQSDTVQGVTWMISQQDSKRFIKMLDSKIKRSLCIEADVPKGCYHIHWRFDNCSVVLVVNKSKNWYRVGIYGMYNDPEVQLD